MLLRFEAVGLAPNRSFKLPGGQADVADALGFSNVHVNRVVQDLRGDGLITWNRSEVTVVQWDRLQAVGGFDAAYLHQDRLDDARSSAGVVLPAGSKGVAA
jgi:DNA-binding transcriptional regulator LsrR (DeoR family)